MAFKSFRKYFLAILTVVVVGGIGVAVWFGIQPPLLSSVKNVQAAPEAAMFVPKQAPFMASLLVNAEDLRMSGLRELSGDRRRQVRADLAEVRKLINTELGIDFKADIAPWLGDELTIALTSWDIDRDPTNGTVPGFLVAASVWDSEQVNTSLKGLWRRQTRRRELVQEDYSGVAIAYPDSFSSLGVAVTDTPVVATAQVGQHYVLFANSPNVLRNAINTLQATQQSLGNSSRYQETLSQLPSERIGLLWLNIQEAQAWLELNKVAEVGMLSSSTAMNQVDSPERPGLNRLNEDAIQATLDGLAGVDIVATNLAIAPGGLVADTLLTSIPNMPFNEAFKEHTAHPIETLDSLKYIPSDSSLILIGHQFDQTWQTLLQKANHQNPLAQRITQAVTDDQKNWSFNVRNDVIPWVSGDYILARTASTSRSLSDHALDSSDISQPSKNDWILVVSTSEDVDTGIQSLDTIAQSQGFNLSTLLIQEQTTTAWTRLNTLIDLNSATTPIRLETEVDGIHAKVDDLDILATSVGAMGKALIVQDNNVANQDSFNQAIAALDSTNDGYLRVNWELVQPLLTEAFPKLEPIFHIGQPLTRALRSVVMTRYGNEAGSQRWGSFWEF